MLSLLPLLLLLLLLLLWHCPSLLGFMNEFMVSFVLHDLMKVLLTKLSVSQYRPILSSRRWVSFRSNVAFQQYCLLVYSGVEDGGVAEGIDDTDAHQTWCCGGCCCCSSAIVRFITNVVKWHSCRRLVFVQHECRNDWSVSQLTSTDE